MMTITEASVEDLKQSKATAQMTVSPQQDNVISVCGVLVYVHPDKREEVEANMLEIEGLEIHGASEEGKLVVTVETDSYKKTGDAITRLQHISGILSLSMIYQHAESIDETENEEENKPESIQTHSIDPSQENKLKSQAEVKEPS